MKPALQRLNQIAVALVLGLAMVFAMGTSSVAEEYAALKGVQGLHSVFDYSLGSADAALLFFPAIRGVYTDKSVLALPSPPKTVIVFHGEAAKLVSTDRTGLNDTQRQTFDKVAEQIRQFKKDGVTMEVCMYAVNALGIDPATLMPEIDQVGNGFISVLGYQAQGYSLVTVQ